MNIHKVRIILFVGLAITLFSLPSCLIKSEGFINKKPGNSSCFTKGELNKIHSHYLRNLSPDQRIYFELWPITTSTDNPCIGMFSYQRRGKNEGGLDVIHPVLAFDGRVECFINNVEVRDSIWSDFYKLYRNSFSENQLGDIKSFFNVMGVSLGGTDPIN